MIIINQSEIIEYLSSKSILKEAFKYYMGHNTALSHPYHNVNHMLTMAFMVKEFVKEPSLGNFGLNMTPKDVLLLCVIFHDFDHSRGIFTDDINVENAINGFRSFVNKWNASLPKTEEETGLVRRIIGMVKKTEPVNHPNFISDEQFEHLANIIRSTQYPYIVETKRLANESCMVMREADIAVALTDDYFSQCLCGLNAELASGNVTETAKKHFEFIMEHMRNFETYSFNTLYQQYADEFTKNYAIISEALS